MSIRIVYATQPVGDIMSAQRYLLSILNDGDLFHIRDAIATLNEFGLADAFLKQDIYAEIEKRTNDCHMGVYGWKV